MAVEFDISEWFPALALSHSRLPANGMMYDQGCIDHHFEPMGRYFSARAPVEGRNG